jgi:ABC-type multidrug transport system ATPase subunit
MAKTVPDERRVHQCSDGGRGCVPLRGILLRSILNWLTVKFREFRFRTFAVYPYVPRNAAAVRENWATHRGKTGSPSIREAARSLCPQRRHHQPMRVAHGTPFGCMRADHPLRRYSRVEYSHAPPRQASLAWPPHVYCPCDGNRRHRIYHSVAPRQFKRHWLWQRSLCRTRSRVVLTRAPRPVARAAMPAEILHNGRNVAFDAHDAVGAGDIEHYNTTAAAEAAATSTTLAELPPVHLAWSKLTFDVPAKKKAKDAAPAKDASAPSSGSSDGGKEQWVPPVMNTIPGGDGARTRVLHECEGSVKPGEMLAILGSSGAGKSTLLNLLAGRVKSSKDCVSGGTVLVNGVKRDFSTYKKLAAFVEQDDCMFGTLTVEEQIRYAALLRLPKGMSKERKLMKVEEVIQELGLSKCRNTVIGNELIKGVSGGERKRCSIGVDLVTSPALLLLDEPTTGLDAFAALNIITTLREMASRGRTVVATIHQPRSSIFALFDKLLVLSEGRTVYFGPAKEASQYFSSLGYTPPQHFNIADYVIYSVSIDYRSKELETKTKKRVLYLADQHNAKHESGLSAVEASAADTDVVAARKASNKVVFQNSWPGEFVLLLKRSLVRLSRDKLSITVRLTQTLVFGILLGIIWLNTGRDGKDLISARSIQGVLFFLSVNMAFDGAFSVIFDFPVERSVLTRERAAGSYRVTAYWCAGFITDFFKALVLNVIFVTLVYWMVGLRSSVTAYLFTILVTLTMSLTGEGFAQTVSVLTGDAQISSAIVPVSIGVNPPVLSAAYVFACLTTSLAVSAFICCQLVVCIFQYNLISLILYFQVWSLTTLLICLCFFYDCRPACVRLPFQVSISSTAAPS